MQSTKTTITLTNSELGELMAAGTYHFYYRQLHHVISPSEATFLSFLLNEWKIKTKERAREWFVCKTKRIKKEMVMSQWTQQSLVKKLKTKGYLKVRMKGIPAKRYFRLNLVKLLTDVNVKMQEKAME